MSEKEKNYFEILNAVDVSAKTEKKNGLTYLSWAWAWCEVKKRHPEAVYKVYERDDGRIYWDDGRTAWVKTGMQINGLEHVEYLPVMDYKNQSIPADKLTSMDVNKSIQRSLTKCAARHGLGLHVYAGEDTPEQDGEKISESVLTDWISSIEGSADVEELKKRYHEAYDAIHPLKDTDAERRIIEAKNNRYRALKVQA
jgi:hypothetical protein